MAHCAQSPGNRLGKTDFGRGAARPRGGSRAFGGGKKAADERGAFLAACGETPRAQRLSPCCQHPAEERSSARWKRKG